MDDPSTRSRPAARWILASCALALGCGSSSTSASPSRSSADAGPLAEDDGPASTGPTPDGGTPPPSGNVDSGMPATGEGGTTPSACGPTIPNVAWTSPYAGWTRGIPTDPGFFPIAVWLQGSWHATELAGLGVNIYVGNNSGTDSLAASDLATLKGQGMYAIVGQDSVGLANIDDTTIVGWWMDPDEPDNAQYDGMGGYGPPVSPSTLVTAYNSYKKADPTRPIYLGLGQGVAYADYEGRGSNPPAESGYVPASDIISFDIYPYNNCSGDANDKVTCGQFWLNASGVDNLHQWSNRESGRVDRLRDDGHRRGHERRAHPVQTASEVWLALIHGPAASSTSSTRGSHRSARTAIFKDANMVTAVTALNKEIKSLAPELNSATRCRTSSRSRARTPRPRSTRWSRPTGLRSTCSRRSRAPERRWARSRSPR